MTTRRWVLVIGMLGGALLAGCGGDDDADMGPATDSGPRAPTFTNVYTTVIARNCSCHITPAGAGGLVMSSQAVAFGNLVGTSAQAGGMCDELRVSPGSPADSVIYRKVSGENLCGDRMPRGRGMLPSSDVDLIERWIAAGAPND